MQSRLSLLWESAKDFLSILFDLLFQTEQTPLDPSVTFRDQPAIVFAVSHASFLRFALTWVALAVIFALSLFWCGYLLGWYRRADQLVTSTRKKSEVLKSY